MYHITCDGLPLMDWRDNDLVLVDPKVKLEVNTVGEGSFTIYKNHPYYDKLKKLKSVFEVTDDHGVIFRGRATGDTVDFDHGMFVDLEGAMAYFNDSIVRSFNYPDDFLEDADYITASKSGNVVAFFLGWLINNHNAQVQDFQKMKLGNVTVTDPNNYLSRSSSEYASTWEVLKAKLFDSSLGGYLCIRYEADGNYIDYLAEFTETNSQEIGFGENLLDLKRETEASETYSAIIPIGVIGLTIEGLEDKDLTDDIVKKGDTLYSRRAVEQYGWIYAPVSETTWEDVTDDANLLTKGADWLVNRGSLLNAMEATAVDLHFTDQQVESLRIYRNVNVRSEPHEVSESLPLAKLEIDLLKPQNTKITVGKTLMALTERTANLQEEAKKRYSKLSKSDEQIRMEVQDEIKKLSASVDVSLEAIALEIQGVDDKYTALAVTLDGVTITDESGQTLIKGSSIDTSTIKANSITADKIVLSGSIEWGDLATDTQNQVTSAQNMALSAYNLGNSANNQVSAWTYPGTTAINGNMLMTGTVKASQLLGGYVGLLDGLQNVLGQIVIDPQTTGYAIELKSTGGGLRLSAASNFWVDSANGSMGITNSGIVCSVPPVPQSANNVSLGTYGFPWSDIYTAYGKFSSLVARVEALEGKIS